MELRSNYGEKYKQRDHHDELQADKPFAEDLERRSLLSQEREGARMTAMLGIKATFSYDRGRAEREFLGLANALGLDIGELQADGKLHRCNVPAKGSRGKGDGSYVLHLDGGVPAGWMKNWIDNVDASYQYERGPTEPPLTDSDRERLAQHKRLIDEKRERDRAERAAVAAADARTLLAMATPIGSDGHPYLKEKKIEAHGLTVARGAIVVPMVNGNGDLVGAQRIIGRDKIFLKGTPVIGAFHAFGALAGAKRIVIAEGVATAATIRQATGCPTVIAFNCGNLESVAKAIRAKHPHAQLIIAADDDYERAANPGLIAATAAASAVGGVMVKPQFPGVRKGGTDFNDLAAVAGIDAVRAQFDAVPPTAGALPMTIFAKLDLSTVKVPEFVLDDALQAGVVLIAGSEGVGKTVQLVSLLSKAAHLCRPDDPLRPLLRRKVIYITEDRQQVERILSSLLLFGGSGCTAEEFHEWFLLVEAVASSPDYVATLRDIYTQQCTLNKSDSTGKSYQAQPVVVFDTRSAVVLTENENDNSEASRIIAMLKQRFALPVIVIGHMAKALKRSDVRQMSLRGAGAAQGDAHQVALFFADQDTGNRYLYLNPPGKRRFDSKIDEIEFVGVANEVTGFNVLGEPKPIVIRHATCRAIQSCERHATKQVARAAADAMEAEQEALRIRGNLLQEAASLWAAGTPASKRDLIKTVRGKEETVTAHLTDLLTECRLMEVTIDMTKYQLVNNSRKSYIVALDAPERERLLESGEVPADKQVPPRALAKSLKGA